MINNSGQILSPKQIAGWLKPSNPHNKNLMVTLPSLQRGAVWKPSQIENLWDSLLRGFPIGAIMLAPYRSEKGAKRFPNQSVETTQGQKYHYHLLDGQQRCNAIALGWVDLWCSKETSPVSLWLDLEPPDKNDERDFVFRVVTTSHRWGYQRKIPTQRLSASERRKALKAFHSAVKAGKEGLVSQRISDLPLSHVWPWDAKAPIPVSLLIKAVEKNPNSSIKVWQVLQKKLENALPYWPSKFEGSSWKDEVERKLASPTPYMKRIHDSLKHMIELYKIPSLILPDEIAADVSELHDDENIERQDPMATWFIRVNSAGTPIGGEELMYSILKSDWPEAENAIGGLSEHFMPPARLLLLASRLILARSLQKDKKPPAAPNVTQFRRLIYGGDKRCPNFKEQLYNFFDAKKSKAKWLFGAIRELLVYANSNTDDRDYRLPPILATEIARQAPDEFFFLLVWLDRMTKKDVKNLTSNMRKRILGVITTLAWFSSNSKTCLNRLWRRLLDCTDNQGVSNFFSGYPLRSSIGLNQKREISLIPLPPPDLLEEAVKKFVSNAFGIGKAKNKWWTDWEWWTNFSGLNENWDKLPDKLQQWYQESLKSWKFTENEDDISKEKMLETWTILIDSLHSKKSLVLYAQREWLVKWFKEFDPVAPLQQEDTDRPWDMDHIHPQKYVYGRHNIPRIIRNWHGSIGNLRAWPFEMNRGDGDISPRHKLCSEPGKNEYNLSRKDLPKASFIDSKSEELQNWLNSCPDERQLVGKYLNMTDRYPDCRRALLTAITKRWVALYREWYDTLNIRAMF